MRRGNGAAVGPSSMALTDEHGMAARITGRKLVPPRPSVRRGRWPVLPLFHIDTAPSMPGT